MSIIEGRNAEILQSIIDGDPYDNPNPYPSRIEQLLMELKEVIEQGGGGTTVDQTYTPTSENAQSGKAVAEALETIPSVTVDQTYSASSTNAQSGTAVAQALQTIPTVTVDQTFNAASANAQSGVAVQEAISADKYTVIFPSFLNPTIVSSLAFTAPDGSAQYVHTLAFHKRYNRPTGIPNGQYIAYTDYGSITISIDDTYMLARWVVTSYSTKQQTVGSTSTMILGAMPIIRVDV